MIYSVFNVDTVQYDYYRANGPRFGERAPVIRGNGRTGQHPDELLARLPSGAVPVGSGKVARGIIATHPGVGVLAGFGAEPNGAVPSGSTWWPIIKAGAVLFFASRLLIYITKRS